MRGRLQRLERQLAVGVRGVPAALRLGQLALFGVVRPGGEHVIAGRFQFRGVSEQGRDRRQEHRSGLATLAGPDEPAHGLREEQRRAHAGGVDADGQPGDVHALGHHPDGHHPAVAGVREGGDLPAGAGVIGEHHDRPGPADPAQQGCVGPGVRVITGDDQAARVGHAPPHLGEPAVGGLQDALHPFALWVQCGPPGLGELIGEHGRAQGAGDLVTGPGPPAHLAGVGQEDDRADHAVVEGRPVAVDIVGHAAPAAVGVRRVGHERDRVGVAAERGAGEGQPAPRGLERLADRVTPGERVARVVDLVEDHQGAPVHRALPVQDRVRGDLCVGHRHPGEVGGGPALRVAVGGVQGDADVVRGLRPLVLEVLGGGDHGDRGDLPAGQQFSGDGQRPGRLACSRGGDKQEIAPGQVKILPVRCLLPAPQGQEQIGPDRSVRAAAILMGCGRGGAHEAERLPAAARLAGQPAPWREDGAARPGRTAGSS